MPLMIGIARERMAGETRVAVVPDVVKKFKALGATVCIETQAGAASYLADDTFGADTIAASAAEVFAAAQILLAVQPPSLDAINAMTPGTVLIGALAPYASKERIDA
jgi:NAD(P) transhydrogenase subunit alpha